MPDFLTGQRTFRVGDWLVDPSLNRITRHSETIYLRSQVMDLLVYLARHQGRVVGTDELLDNVWPGKVVTGGTVYNCVAELRRALGDGAVQPVFVETIPKKGYRLLAPVEPVDDRDPPGVRRRRMTWVSAGAAAVVLIVALLLAYPWSSYRPESIERGVATSDPDSITESLAPERSVAVLPFANRSAHEDNGYFVDGIHDDILSRLARIGSLMVISRTSVEKFRDTSQSMKEIGASLGARNILEGSVQRSGDRVRINVQLIDVTTDTHLWADTYDRELTAENVFAIQSEIARAIAESLEATLSPDERIQLDRTPTESLPALEAYFLGRQSMAKRTSASLAEAERQFKQAVALDPQYALAYVGLADAYMLQVHFGGQPLDRQQELANPLIEKALAINGRLGEAYVSMAQLASNAEPQERESLFEKGIALAPSYSAGYLWYGVFLANQGRTSEALEQLTEAVRLDPLSSVIRVRVGDVLESLGRFDEARYQIESIIRIDPDFAHAYFFLGTLEWFVNGRLDNAVVQIRKAFAIDPENPQYSTYLAGLWSNLGGTSEAAYWTEKAQAVAGGSGLMSHLAALFTKVNQGDIAGAVGNAEAVLAEIPTDPNALWILSLHDLQAGHGSAAVARYLTAYPALRNAAATIDFTNYMAAVELAYALKATGDEARANWLLEHSLQYLRTIPRLGGYGYFIMDTRIHAMQGKREEALAALRQAVDAGWRVSWRIYLKHDPALAALHDEPGYQAIVAELEADMALQRERVRAMEASGELAPIADYSATRAP